MSKEKFTITGYRVMDIFPATRIPENATVCNRHGIVGKCCYCEPEKNDGK